MITRAWASEAGRDVAVIADKRLHESRNGEHRDKVCIGHTFMELITVSLVVSMT